MSFLPYLFRVLSFGTPFDGKSLFVLPYLIHSLTFSPLLYEYLLSLTVHRLGLARWDRVASWTLASRPWTYWLRRCCPYGRQVPSSSRSTSLIKNTRGDPESTCRGATNYDCHCHDRNIYGLRLSHVPTFSERRISQCTEYNWIYGRASTGHLL